MIHDKRNSANQDLIEAITILRQLCTPTAEIARRLHIDQATTQHVIEHGTLPARQLPLLWADDRDGYRPNDGETGR